MNLYTLQKDGSAAIGPNLSSSHENAKADSLIESSASTIVDPQPGTATLTFNPTSSLQIQAAGKHAASCPGPATQLEIPIFSPTSGRPVYNSIRPRPRKGNCRLVLAEDSLEEAIARTTYKWGPGRNPIVRIGADDDLSADEFEMVNRSLLNRTVGFETRKWGSFEWRYAGKSERAAYAADNLLVLERVVAGGGGSGAGGKGQRVRVAQLVRNDEFRTAGTKYMAAGNGGRLQMVLSGEKGRGVVDEVMVVVTCLVMLKKEVDRLRTIQITAITAGSGAS